MQDKTDLIEAIVRKDDGEDAAAKLEALRAMIPVAEPTAKNLKMQAFDVERDVWCVVKEIDFTSNRIWLSNGHVSFGRALDKTKIRIFLVDNPKPS